MIKWDDAQTILQRFCQDTSTAGIAFQNLMLNVGYKMVLEGLQRQVTEQQSTTDLVSGTRNYQVPPDCNMPKTLVLVSGTNRYVLQEEQSDARWELRRLSAQTGQPVAFHFRPRFGVGGGIIELDPIPGSSSYDLEMTYEATERDLSKTAYTTGTISLTHGSSTLTGSGTTFAADMVGRYVRPLADGAERLPYKIKTFSSTTSMILENVYQGTNQSSMSYEIFEMFAMPEGCHMLPIYYAAWQHWQTKGNPKMAQTYEAFYLGGMAQAQKRYSTVTRNNIIESGDAELSGILDNSYPFWFPAGVTP